MITIFTPTYNRAYTLERLYQSLCRQTSDDFEWLIVDDGSTDGTEALIRTFAEEAKICISYIRQINGGKHRAINRGVKEAKGDLFFIVDSDDYLVDNAVEIINQHYLSIVHNENIAGLCFLKIYPDGRKVGGEETWRMVDCTSLEARYKYHMRGDMAEIVRTDVFRQFPFPEFEKEKFCPEALVFNRIAQHYTLRYVYEKVYVCEYLSDGLTAKITKIRMQSPRASALHYAELFSYDIPCKQKIKAGINFWRFAFCKSPIAFRQSCSQVGLGGVIWMLLGWGMHIRDRKQNKNRDR